MQKRRWPVGLVLSLIVVLILLFTGWKGWGMVYRHLSASPISRNDYAEDATTLTHSFHVSRRLRLPAEAPFLE